MKHSTSPDLNRSSVFMHLARFSAAAIPLAASLTASLRTLSSRGLLIGALAASAAMLAPPAFAQNDDTPPALDTASAVKAPTTPS